MMRASDRTIIQAVVDGVDQVAHEMEMKWGVDRLRLLVDDDLRARFDQQAELFDDAILAKDAKDVREHGDAMRRGWQALDQAAADAGQSELAPSVWEFQTANGVIAVVRTNPEAHAVAGDERGVEVWTLDEIAELIANFPEAVRAVKRVFPGAKVTDVKPIDWTIGDELPSLLS